MLHVGHGASNVTAAALSEEDRRTVWKLLKLCLVSKRSGQFSCLFCGHSCISIFFKSRG